MSPPPDTVPSREEALRAANAQLRLILDSPSIIIFSLDREYRYTSFNKNHAETIRTIWGVDITVGMDMLQVIQDPGDRAKAKVNFDRAMAGEEFTLLEEYGDEALYRTFYEDRYCPTRGDDGEILGVTVFVTDVTERLRAAEERVELEKRVQEAARLESLGVMAGSIAHDFNNLLVGILGSAAFLLDELPDDAATRPSLETIERSAQRAADLTRQLLAYSGKRPFVSEVLDLDEAIYELSALLESSISKKATLEHHPSPEPATIFGGASQIRQVLMNLLLNASDALGGETGTIAIRTGVDTLSPEAAARRAPRFELVTGDYAFVEIQDDGCGMDAEDLEQIYEPFYTTKSTGRGLGLAAALGIVRGHGGFIDASSTPGAGTIFRVGFPHVAEQPAPARVAPARDVTVEGHVLVVDDEEGVRELALRTLEEDGVDATAAADGISGVKRFLDDAATYDAVVLDMTMPGLSGSQVLDTIRAARPDLPVVVMSGYSSEDFAPLLTGDGPTVFLEKPFRPDDLRRALATVMA